MSDFLCEPLGPTHSKEDFDCGDAALNAWLQKRAGQDLRRHVAVVHVMVPKLEPTRIAGVFALSATSLTIDCLPSTVSHKLPKYSEVPAALIGRLGRDVAFPGLGPTLLFAAFKRILLSSQEMAVALVVVDAKNAVARRFYERHGFECLSGSETRLFIPIQSVAKTLGQD